MKIPFNKEWILIEKEDYANYLFVVPPWEGYTFLPQKWGFKNGRFLGAEYFDGQCNLFMLKESFEESNRKNYDSLFNNPKIWYKLNQLTESNSNKLVSFSKKVKALDYSKLSNKRILSLIDRFFFLQMMVHTPRGPMWLLETPNNILTNYLQGYLQELANRKNVKIEPEEAFRIMIISLKENILVRERLDLAKIAEINEDEFRLKKLQGHTAKYGWLEYGLQGRILEKDYFENELKKICGEGAKQYIERNKKENLEIASKQKQIINKYGIGKSHRLIFEIIRDSFYARLQSKYAQFFSYYAFEPLFKEIAKRSGLTLEQIRFLALQDFKKVLIGKKDYSELVDERRHYSLHISDKRKTVFWVGKEAKEKMARIKFKTEESILVGSTEIKGQVAFKGRTSGRVKIVNTVQEIVKMHAGNILISHMTNPDILPAMKLASAIVTDLGGITCHAAIVARELKKPCIIGTKIATKILKDGDLVEVDAEKGVVKILKR